MKKNIMIASFILLVVMLSFGEVSSDITDYVVRASGQFDDLYWPDGGSPDAEKLQMLIDNNNHTKYLVKAETSWLNLYTERSSLLTSYSISSANDSPMRDPNSWLLQGWDERNGEWITIHSVTNQPVWEERFQTKTWGVAPSEWFSSYRLLITANNGSSDGCMQMAELRLFGELGSTVEVQAPPASVALNPSETSVQMGYIGYCNTDRLNIRNSAGTGGRIIGLLVQDNIVQVVEKTNWTQKIDDMDAPWVKIVNDQYEGWVYGGFISPAAFIGGMYKASAPQSSSLKAGNPVTHTANSVRFNMHYVPAGNTFTMGEHIYWNSPTRVSLTKNFWMGETEVTQALWEDVWGTTWPNADPADAKNDWYSEITVGDGPDYPAFNINWYEAVVFCNLLTLADGHTEDAEQVYYSDSDLTNAYTKADAVNTAEVYADWNKRGYRLPTEAEWEYAARYIDGSSWNNGDHVVGDTYFGCYIEKGETHSASGSPMASDERLGEYIWWSGNLGMSGGQQQVGQKKTNTLGLHDMSGNVGEWCYDWFSSYSGKPETNPTGPENGSKRVIRGGSWSAYREGVCTADRWSEGPLDNSGLTGFRLCRTGE